MLGTPYLVNCPWLVRVAGREVRVLERDLAATHDVKETLAVLLVGVVFWIVVPNLYGWVSRSTLGASAADITHPFREPSPDHLGVLADLTYGITQNSLATITKRFRRCGGGSRTPVGEVMLLCIHERHLLGAGDALVPQPVVHLGGHGSIGSTS